MFEFRGFYIAEAIFAYLSPAQYDIDGLKDKFITLLNKVNETTPDKT